MMIKKLSIIMVFLVIPSIALANEYRVTSISTDWKDKVCTIRVSEFVDSNAEQPIRSNVRETQLTGFDFDLWAQSLNINSRLSYKLVEEKLDVKIAKHRGEDVLRLSE